MGVYTWKTHNTSYVYIGDRKSKKLVGRFDEIVFFYIRHNKDVQRRLYGFLKNSNDPRLRKLAEEIEKQRKETKNTGRRGYRLSSEYEEFIELFKEFLKNITKKKKHGKRKKIGKRTLKDHEQNLRMLISLGLFDPADIDKTFKRFVAWIETAEISNDRKRNLVKTYEYALMFIKRCDLIEKLPTYQKKRINNPEWLPNREELKIFFEALNSLEAKAYFQTMLSSGTRPERLYLVREDDIDFRNKIIRVEDVDIDSTKRVFTIVLTEEAVYWLRKWLDELEMLKQEGKRVCKYVFSETNIRRV